VGRWNNGLDLVRKTKVPKGEDTRMKQSNRKRIYLSVVLAVLALVIAKALGFVGMALAGAGHGSEVLGFLFLSPIVHSSKYPYVALGPYIWASVGALIPWVSNWHIKIATIILIVANYLGAARDISASIDETGTPFFAYQLFARIPQVAFPFVVTYVVFQVIVFRRIIAVDKTKRDL
jgi:hypothetical protein